MLLSEIIKNCKIKKVIGNTDCDIKNIVVDSNKLCSDCLFVCINGTETDSHKLAPSLSDKGVKAFITEREIETDLPQVIVENTRKELSTLSSNFHNNPQGKLKIIGVTGTNGKTSITYIMKSILEYSGKRVGIIGTLGAKIYEVNYNIDLTTPDPLVLGDLLEKMVDAGIEYVVMEVSAHALDLMRVEGIHFKIAVFTNLTQDHLDYFGNMENYKTAKLKLFSEDRSEYAVVNADDKVGMEIAAMRKNTITYGISNPSDSFAIDIEESPDGIKFVMNVMDSVFNVHTNLSGRFNVYNILAAATACRILGVSVDDIGSAIEKTQIVPGRMECIGKKGDAAIFVDYAHTPDGLKNILESARKITSGRLVCLFGCGGNRDKTKRKIMGEIAGEYADFTIITSDNPRYEEPMLIINDIESGIMEKTKNYVIIQNREQALVYAVRYISGNDVLTICGKGAENYQEILGVKHPFNDKKMVQKLLGE